MSKKTVNAGNLTVNKPSPKTQEQRLYLESIRKNDVTIVYGPAGSGKSWLAVSQAAYQFSKKTVTKLVFTRPAIEAFGEKIGFLPGDTNEKMAPYMMPIIAALEQHLSKETILSMFASGQIQVVPLCFMRGRTFKDAFVILDEAQNTTPEQMRMFLTRIGHGTKVVIDGDLRQCDRLYASLNGLKDAINKLDGVDGVRIVELTDTSIVRSQIAARIEQRYFYEEQHGTEQI